MKYAVLTDPGILRKKNEDACLAKNNIFAVADGMGGHKAGEIASQIALSSIEKSLSGARKDNPSETLILSIKDANEAISKKSMKNIKQWGMGTTLTLILFKEDNYFIGHIGDSRAYLLRENNLIQLTKDHSLVADLVKKKYLSKEEARAFPHRNIITRALGATPDIEIDISSGKTKKEDRFLLCTDGLTEMLKDEEIKQIIESEKSLSTICEKLIATANQYGGKDNITVVLIEV